MRKIIASEFVSLDGVFEAPDQWHFPYFDEKMGQEIMAAMGQTDAMLMGRVNYEEWAEFWPNQDPEENPAAGFMNGVRKFVVSTTLKEPLGWDNSTLIKENVAEEIAGLKRQTGGDIAISGSASLVRSLLKDGLIDELRLMVHPVVVGSGKRLFEGGGDQIALELADSRTLSTGVVYLTYRPVSGRDNDDQKEVREMEARIEREVTTLVLGGTGKTGRRVAERLEERGLPVRVGSRSGEPPFDWENPDTWAPALEGVESVYVSYFPDLAIPGAVEAVRSFAELAVGTGVRRLVLLSGRGEEEAQRAEQALREVGDEAGVEWTIVRCAWFMQNFDENYLLEPILGGEVALPSGDVPEPFVDADDIADVAVAALTEDGHAGELYELTGPRLLTMEEAVGEISKATGRKIRFVSVSLEEYESVLAEADVPPEFLSFLTYLFGTVLDGRNAHLADGVRRALGREPRDFADYARDAAATGVWEG